MSLIAGRGCRWPPRRDSVSPCAPLSGGRDTHDGHENSPILVFFSNLLDLTWDGDGNPVLLYVTSSSVEPGPGGDPREWTLTHWNGAEWLSTVITTSDHNMYMGSLYVDPDVWRVIGQTETGPQPWGTVGEVAIWESRDEGRSWARTARVTANSVLNHSYVRRTVNARDPFYTFWADGDPNQLSESRLYFTTSTGDQLWMLPYEMREELGDPIDVTRDPS